MKRRNQNKMASRSRGRDQWYYSKATSKETAVSPDHRDSIVAELRQSICALQLSTIKYVSHRAENTVVRKYLTEFLESDPSSADISECYAAINTVGLENL